MDESVGNETVDTGTGTDEVTTSDEGSQTEPPVIRADSNFHDISLDVKKSGQTINEPIVIRTDDTDDVIRVHLKKDGQPYTGIKSATFYGTKQDLTIIANDPATVEDDVLLYSVPKELANIGGKIKNAYFMIDGKITTETFVITVLKTVNFKGESKDYIPGLNSLIDKWNATSKEWNTKLNGIDQDIKNLSMSEMLKNKMDVALAGAKSDYMSTFNKSVDNLNNVVTELSGKESIATDKGKELDDAIAKVNQSISDVNAWLVEVQNKITTANKEFTDAQRKSVSDVITQLKATIADTQKTADNLGTQLTTINDNIKAINVPDLNASVKKANDTADSANTTANNAIAKFDSYYTKDDVDTKLANYTDTSDLNKLLESYVLATKLTEILGDYSKSDDIKSWIATSANQTKEYAAESIKAIIGAAPATLDTIGELADAVTKNKDGVQAINEGITKKADKTDVTALQNTLSKLITPISAEDYKVLEDAGTVDPKIMYVIPDA